MSAVRGGSWGKMKLIRNGIGLNCTVDFLTMSEGGGVYIIPGSYKHRIGSQPPLVKLRSGGKALLARIKSTQANC